MATITLTTSPQELTGSDMGVLVKGSAPFVYGFGATAPTDGLRHENVVEPLNYSGGYGSLWVWLSGSNSQSLYYVVAV